MRNLILLLSILLFTDIVIADEVFLKNGKTWVNVNVLEEYSTDEEIIIYTSMKKRITIKRDTILGIKYKKFNSRKKSELVELEEPFILEEDEYLKDSNEQDIILNNNDNIQNTMISIGPGISKAIGKGSDDINIGFNGAVTGLARINDYVYIGARVGYNYFSVDMGELEDAYPGVSFSASISILELTPVLRIFPTLVQGGNTNLFLQAGFGIYNITASAKASYQGESDSDSESKTESGINISIGILTGAQDGIRIEIVPNLNIIFTENETTKYLAINLNAHL